MESIPCIFGHGPSDDVVITENGFQGRRCPQCATIYISPRPEPSEVFDLYHHDKAYVSAAYHVGYNPGAELAARRHFHAISDRSPFRVNGALPKSVLEIGCGGGRVLRLAKEHGMDAYGVELNPHQADHVRNNLGIACETVPFTRNSFGDKKFDVIFHCDVTSHFHDPIGDFSAMHDKLADGGYLVFETGNIPDMDRGYYKDFVAFQYPDHLFFFGESAIRELLKRTGFSEVRIASWSILPQLRLRQFARRFRSTAKPSSLKPAPAATLSAKQKALRLVFARANDFIRYGVGSILSNPRHPRTLLIWAKK